MMAEFAFAPRQPVFVQGQPVRLELANSGYVTHVFSSPGFFRSVAIRSVVTGPSRPPIRPAGWPDDAMTELTLLTVTEILAMTPHELELARESTNPFDAPPAAATPIDFGDLLGDLPLGAFDLGAPAEEAAPPEGEALPALPPAGPAPADGDALPADPFAVPPAEPLPADEPAVAADEPAPALEVPALAAEEPAPAVEPVDAIPLEDEALLLAEWDGADDFTGMTRIDIPPGASVWVTFVPVRTGTFGLANLRPFAALGMFGRITIVPPDQAPIRTEIALPAADLTLLEGEAMEPPESVAVPAP